MAIGGKRNGSIVISPYDLTFDLQVQIREKVEDLFLAVFFQRPGISQILKGNMSKNERFLKPYDACPFLEFPPPRALAKYRGVSYDK